MGWINRLLPERMRKDVPSKRTWRDRWRRLASMDQDEILDRLRQQVTAHADALKYKLGFSFDGDAPKAQVARQGRFFFTSGQVPVLVSLLRDRLPQEAEQIVQRAERICRHRFDLLGYEDLDYGAAIDWHCDRVHGKRAPRKPWFKIDYLDFSEVGDSKITWELNRHQHLVTLAKAYRLTGDGKFAGEVFRQWRHWHIENPYPIGINWSSSLEVAFRSLSWIWMYHLLEGSTALLLGFRKEWLRAQAVNGRHIEHFLSTYFSPNTHLLGEAVALFFLGTMCSELPAAERWKLLGWRLVLREAQRQVQADGFHFEQSTYYHVYALDLFLHAGLLASINDVPTRSDFDNTLERMLDALYLLARAGVPPRLGDDDGGRLFDPRRNQAEHLLDPLATGAVLFGRGDFKYVAGGLREETLWLLGEQGIAEFDRLPTMTPMQNSAALQGAGLYMLANSDPKQQLIIDAGPQGAATAGHGHADALSVCVNREGHALLIDPGTCDYVGPERDLFRGTSAHNTLLVDGAGQSESKGPFAWAKLPNVKAEGWISGETFDLFAGSHDGYSRLQAPVVHRRWVFSLKSRFWLVRDMALGAGEHQLDLFWHLGPELSRRSGGSNIFLDAGGCTGLRVLAAKAHGWSQDIRQGWWSPVYGRKQRLDVLHFSTVAELPTEFVTLLAPIAEPSPEPGEFVKIESSSAKDIVRGYRYTSSEEEHWMVFGSQGKVWSLGLWTSDAGFLYWGGERDDGCRRVIVCNSTFVEIGGENVFSSAKSVLRCEIIKSAQNSEVFCSDQGVVVMKDLLRWVWDELEPTLTNGFSSGKAGL